MSSFGDWISKKKSQLFLNGDWLFVTETPTTSDEPQSNDLALKFDTPEKVLAHITANDLESIKLIYERTKKSEASVDSIENLTRDKAKTLLGTASFASAIFFGVTSFFSSSSANLPWWIVAVELILFILLACHLIHSLVIGMEVMTREQSINASPDEFLNSYGSSVEAYKNAIAQTLAYANKSHEFIRKRSNKLILGQRAFQYGLMYFALLVVLHIFSTSYLRMPTAGEQQTKRMESLFSVQDQSLRAIAGNIKDVALLHQTNSEVIGKQRELEIRITDLSKAIAALRRDVASLTPKSGRGIKKSATIPKDGSVKEK
jgi:hypothetical protein